MSKKDYRIAWHKDRDHPHEFVVGCLMTREEAEAMAKDANRAWGEDLARVVSADTTSRRKLTHLSLFTGIGGIDLAAEWAGFRTVGQVEIDDYAVAVLAKHWPDVPRWRDIKDVSAGSFREKTGERSPLLITGGFPCQPVSQAGKRCGSEDVRWLWPEMFRVVRELRPSWVIGENVNGLISLGLEDVLSDLEREKYTVRVFNIPALAVGAWHQRERVFIVAHTDDPGKAQCRGDERVGRIGEPGTGTYPHPRGESRKLWIPRPEEDEKDPRGDHPTDPEEPGLEGGLSEGDPCPHGCPAEPGRGGWPAHWWEAEPGVGRVADGVPSRVDRLRCLGNAVVPQQVYPILEAIAAIERAGGK